MKGHLRLLSGKKLNSPSGDSTRPTTALVREAVINILKEKIYNSNWLDLYSGSGIIGCEAIEHGANSVLAIESNRKVFRICESNLEKICSSSQNTVKAKVINTEANKFLNYGFRNFIEKTKGKDDCSYKRFDFVYIDPPYKKSTYYPELNQLLIGDWVMKECIAICEFSLESNSINLPSNWSIKDKKSYGKTGLIFLTPNLA